MTLRGARMYEFLDRLVSIALPRIRDFRGLNPGSFDGRGNYSLGIREQIIFPEIDYDAIDQVRGLDVAITTTARDGRAGARAAARRSACRSRPTTKGAAAMAKKSLVVKQQRARRSTRRATTRAATAAAARAPSSEVRALPDLPARARARGRHSGHDEVELVGETTMLTDPIADMLTRIRNANKALHEHAPRCRPRG